MSAAKMLADSTQGDPLTDTIPGVGAKRRKSHDKRKTKKQKKETRKKSAKRSSSENDLDSDLDLEKELKPIGDYIKDRRKMLDQMFRCLRGGSLQRNLPDVLKDLSLEDLKQRCQNQLEIMSKKRIKRILAGDDPANISSSGTDDDSSEDEELNKGQDTGEEEQMADSTSQPGEEQEEDQEEDQGSMEDDEEEEEGEAEVDEGDIDDIEEEETVEDYEDIEEGEMTDESGETTKEQNAPSDVESGHYSNTAQVAGQHCPKEDNSGRSPVYSGSPEPGEVDNSNLSDQASLTESEGEVPIQGDAEEAEGSPYEDTEEQAVMQEVQADVPMGQADVPLGQADVPLGQADVPLGQAEDQRASDRAQEGAGPALSRNQMELLELEMRARAIKAMLKAHEVREKRLEDG